MLEINTQTYIYLKQFKLCISYSNNTISNKILNYHLKFNELFRRRGLVKPLNLTTNKANSDTLLDFSSLIKEMKDYCRTKTSLLPSVKESIVPKANKLEYIFSQSNSAGKSLKEEKLNDFLNNEGIFQINTSIVMKELKFNK